MAGRPVLRALADELGILPGYLDWRGRRVHTTDAQRVALLRAMGHEAGSEAAARRALAALSRTTPALAAVRVVAGAARRLGVALDGSSRARRLELREESGRVHRRESRGGASASLLGVRLPTGYHSLVLEVGERRLGQRLIVTPGRCPLPRGRSFGLTANLYTVRSPRNWGFGDLTDLCGLVAFGARIGAAFVGLNPLHALRSGDAVGPYSPVSRLFRSFLYLDPAATPELGDSARARALLAAPNTRQALEDLRAAPRLDYARVRALKLAVYRELHRTFAARHRGRDTTRGRAYARYREQHGRALIDFATFEALAERHGTTDWRVWPKAYRDHRAPAVARFRAAHAEDVDLHCFLQFEIDRQLAGAAAAARRAGMPIGIYQDLALGAAPGGSDRWALPEAFLDGVHVGAPPDDYALEGQDWGLPPLDPRRLAADGYDYWIHLLRGALAHAGALRIDHVMGLVRQFWIPAGGTGADGAYVRFPADDLLGILALEATRARACVVGEDLGTVPAGLRRKLAGRGVLSSRVLLFERTRAGTFRPAARYPRRALVTANTHDLPPLAGYWNGTDLDLRARIGLLAGTALADARRARERERRAIVRRLRGDRALPRSPRGGDRETVDAVRLRAAVHAFLCRTPSALAGIALDDLAGEVEPVNLPGVGADRYPSWTRRMCLPLARIAQAPESRAALAGTRGRVAGRGKG
jgi:4-alpha-glucanotransferase